jgi:hypothetical protein
MMSNKCGTGKDFGENVGTIAMSGDSDGQKGAGLNMLSDEMIMQVNVFHVGMISSVCRQCNSTCIVSIKFERESKHYKMT